MNKFNLTALSAAFCLAMSTGALAGAMSKADYNTAKADIASGYKSDAAACAAMTGNARDVCVQEAKGREKIAKAQLVANDRPSNQHRYDVRIAKADAAYAVAKEKCDDFSGSAKAVCRKEADRAHVTAKADARLAEKAGDANAAARQKTAEARKDAAADKRDADYAVAKEKCDAYADDVKSTCIKDAKARYGQS